jgi:hypothetical protein
LARGNLLLSRLWCLSGGEAKRLWWRDSARYLASAIRGREHRRASLRD